MKTKTRYWIDAGRPHTLPLAVSGIGLGNLLAWHAGYFDWKICLFSILTALFLQVLSNLANDYGDSKHGTDNENRLGPKRAVQSGVISSEEMLRAVILLSVLSFLSGILLLFFSYPVLGWKPILFMLFIGIAAIWAAFGYTASSKPYGYLGFGDLFVFLFFGLVAVAGAFYLQHPHLATGIWPAALAMGFFSTAVLNLNNLRDIENDKQSGKYTIPVRLGLTNAKHYHAILVNCGVMLSFYFLSFVYNAWWNWFFALPLVFCFRNVIVVYQNENPSELYPLLKQFSLSVLFFVISVGVSLFLLN